MYIHIYIYIHREREREKERYIIIIIIIIMVIIIIIMIYHITYCISHVISYPKEPTTKPQGMSGTPSPPTKSFPTKSP